jgi:DNA polymerase-3 subunit gamma/tau
LTLVDGALTSGVQPVDLLSGALEFLRDVMVLAAGAEILPLAASPGQRPRLQAVTARWPLDSILAAQQILAEARGRLRGSPHGRLLVELALCRVCRLESFAELGELVARLSALETGTPANASPLKKKSALPEKTPAAPPPAPSPSPRDGPEDAAATQPGFRPSPPPEDAPTLEAVLAAWPDVVARIGAELGAKLNRLRPTAIPGPNSLAIGVPAGYNWVADACDTTEGRSRIESALRATLGRHLTVQFDRAQPEADPPPAAAPGPAGLDDDLAGDPMVQKVIELFEARRVAIKNED